MSTTPESFTRFSREVVTPAPALLDAIAASWMADSEKELGTSPLLSALIVFGVFSFFGLVLSCFVPQRWLMIGFTSGAGLLLGSVFFVKSRASRQNLQAMMNELKAATRAVRHTLDLSGPHRFVFHEHGLVVLARLAAGRTFVHDICSAADHPWDKPVNAAYEAKTLKSRWVWYDIDGPSGRKFEALGFAMDGPPLVPVVREEFADPDELGAFVDLFGDEWLPDDYVAKLDFDNLIAADDALAARASNS
jgi:hypothetical protein